MFYRPTSYDTRVINEETQELARLVDSLDNKRLCASKIDRRLLQKIGTKLKRLAKLKANLDTKLFQSTITNYQDK